jgi:hypothetical protein
VGDGLNLEMRKVEAFLLEGSTQHPLSGGQRLPLGRVWGLQPIVVEADSPGRTQEDPVFIYHEKEPHYPDQNILLEVLGSREDQIKRGDHCIVLPGNHHDPTQKSGTGMTHSLLVQKAM